MEKSKFIKNLFVIYLIFILFLIITDLVLGLLFIPGEATISNKNDYYHHGLRPSKKAKIEWINEKYFMFTNSMGFRDCCIRSIKLKPDLYRIIFIGDSFTEGKGLPYEQTFVGIIDKYESKNHIEVLNAGVSSYSPKLYYLRIKYLIDLGLKFNELFVFIDISDIQDEIKYKDFIPNEKVSKSVIGKTIERITNDLLLPRSYFFRLFYFKFNYNKILKSELDKVQMQNKYWGYASYHQVMAKWTTDETEFNKWGRFGVALAELNMNNLADLCKKEGIKLNLVVYPWAEQIRKKDIDSRQVKIWEKLSKERNLNFINLFPDFINKDSEDNIKKYFFENDVHWNKYGNQYVARLFLDKYKIIKNDLEKR